MTRSLLRENICLFLDVDGTLLDLASSPQDVMVPPSLIGDLELATKKVGGALALVSGRSIEVIDRLFRPLRLRAAGVHGAQMRMTENGLVEVAAGAALPVELRARLAALPTGFPGALAEDKGASVALHYRHCPDRRDELLAAISAEIERQHDSSLTVLPGHFVFEAKRRGRNKGTAVTAFMRTAPFRGRRPVVFGDDVTDEAAFRAAIRLGGAAFSVGRDVKGVSGGFDEPLDVRRWVAKLAATAKPREELLAETKKAPNAYGLWRAIRSAGE